MGRLFGGGWEKGGVGQGRSRIRLINSRLRPFNKLWCFHGIPSIKMCYEDRNLSKIPTRILGSGEFEHLTAGRFVNSPRMLSQYTKDA